MGAGAELGVHPWSPFQPPPPGTPPLTLQTSTLRIPNQSHSSIKPGPRDEKEGAPPVLSDAREETPTACGLHASSREGTGSSRWAGEVGGVQGPPSPAGGPSRPLPAPAAP